LAARRDARPLPLLRLPLAGDGHRPPRAREHPAPPARPGGAADGPRPRLDGGPGRPLHRAALQTVRTMGTVPMRGPSPGCGDGAWPRTGPGPALSGLADLFRLLVPAHLVADAVAHL